MNEDLYNARFGMKSILNYIYININTYIKNERRSVQAEWVKRPEKKILNFLFN